MPMKDLFRTLFSIRSSAGPHRSALCPRGATIIRERVKMAIGHPVSCALWALWDWLVLSGWRNLAVRNDRRNCLLAPEGALKELIDAAGPQERNRVHLHILEQAQPKE